MDRIGMQWWAGLVKTSVGIGRIGQTVCRNGRNWSGFMQKWVGVGKMFCLRKASLVKTVFRMGLVKRYVEMGGIGQYAKYWDLVKLYAELYTGTL